ncbi:MAG: class I SAM-dependent methyltransferase [Candidatus Eisenbacteria bacterium]|uniref:Class I SAM-dependent methyltransferase n=1 Tax=Eiseniibacteriota bacterium TaxID=2212470 RepID=A0A933W8C1_UNCEI|nr:class I SAM-dependent methyltransferase [Candidatus Eisenbacteria bacterium]
MSAPGALLERWRETREGFAPLFLEPILEPAFAHLEPAIGPGRTCLDLGSGAGHVAAAVRACGGHTIALDVDVPELARARHRFPGGEALAADAARLPLADGSVDAIFCFSVLQYTDRPSAIAEMRRVLRADGRLVVVENLAGSPVALAYRAWRAIAGIRYPDRLTPRRHLAWSERGMFLRHFPIGRCDACSLISPLLLALPRVYAADASEGPHSPVRTWLNRVRRWDSAWLEAVPALRHGAWMLIFRG